MPQVLPPGKSVHRPNSGGRGPIIIGLRFRNGRVPPLFEELVSTLVAGSCRSFPQDSSNVFSFMR